MVEKIGILKLNSHGLFTFQYSGKIAYKGMVDRDG